MAEAVILQNLGTERAVLSGLFQWGYDSYIDIIDFLTSESFTSLNNQKIFLTLKSLFNQGYKKVDLPTFTTSATSLGYDICNSKTDLEFIRSLMNFPINIENVRGHAAQLMCLHIARMAQERHKQAYLDLKEINGTEGISHILNLSEAPIFELSNELNMSKDEAPELLGEGIDEYLQHLIDNPVEMMGVPTPWPIFNGMIGGGIRTGVALIAARPKTGKTTLAKECGLHLAGKLGIPVLMLDTEMKKWDQVHRSLSGLSGVPTRQIETGKFGQNPEQLREVRKAQEYLKKIPYSHKRIGGKEFEEVLSIIRRWIYQEVGFDENGKANPHLVIYDYFKLMSTKSLKDIQEYQAIGFQVSALTDFCNDYDTPVLAFVQVNRDGLTKDTTDIISQSDRLLWLCTSLTLFKRKTKEEIAEDDPKNGNMKLIPLEARFGTPIDEGDYINMDMNGEVSTIKELSTQRTAIELEDAEDTGFDLEEEEEDNNG